MLRNRVLETLFTARMFNSTPTRDTKHFYHLSPNAAAMNWGYQLVWGKPQPESDKHIFFLLFRLK